MKELKFNSKAGIFGLAGTALFGVIFFFILGDGESDRSPDPRPTDEREFKGTPLIKENSTDSKSLSFDQIDTAKLLISQIRSLKANVQDARAKAEKAGWIEEALREYTQTFGTEFEERHAELESAINELAERPISPLFPVKTDLSNALLRVWQLKIQGPNGSKESALENLRLFEEEIERADRELIVLAVQSGEEVGENGLPRKSVAKSPEFTANTVILKGSTLYESEEAVAEIFKGVGGRSSILERFVNEGIVVSAPATILAETSGREGPSGAKEIKIDWRGREKLVWVLEGNLLPKTHRAFKFATEGDRRVSMANYANILDGTQVETIGKVQVSKFIGFVEALNEGLISEAEGRKTLILPESILGVGNPCEFVQLVGNRLIYEGVVSASEYVQLALIRDSFFEEPYESPEAFYTELKRGGGYQTDNPLFGNGLVFERFEEFATKGGTVRLIPVFRAVSVHL